MVGATGTYDTRRITGSIGRNALRWLLQLWRWPLSVTTVSKSKNNN